MKQNTFSNLEASKIEKRKKEIELGSPIHDFYIETTFREKPLELKCKQTLLAQLSP